MLDFLRNTDAEYLYLVGDVFDGWSLSRTWYWHQLHNDIIQKVLRKARKGSKVVYIPGNHDEFARQFFHLQFGDITVLPRAVHTTADGRQLLIIHGDEFDGFIRHARWLSLLGSFMYQRILKLNRVFNEVRRRAGRPYWSLSAFLKQKAKQAVQYVADFERVIAEEARKWEVDGVVCGHIHQAEMRFIDGILYANTGDWVESCTALVEHADGRLEILNWANPESHPIPTMQLRSSGDGIPDPAMLSLPAR